MLRTSTLFLDKKSERVKRAAVLIKTSPTFILDKRIKTLNKVY
jgi:hypothetical protein